MAYLPIIYVNGLLLTGLGALMLLPALIDFAGDNPDWEFFVGMAFATSTIGLLLSTATRGSNMAKLGLRHAFILTTSVWIVMAGAAALPFLVLRIGYTDAFFEAMSGITTTGSTVLVGLDSMALGILFWRAVLQWLGGVGIIVMGIFILPYLRVGGMQLFKLESSERSEKIVARTVDLTGFIVAIYVLLTTACAIGYGFAGMSAFDAICHAMTTLSTGGYANHDASFVNYNAAAHWISVVFMASGALPFIAYIRTVRNQPLSLWRDPQARSLVTLLAVVGFAMATWLSLSHDVRFADAIRLSFFNVVSVVTTTGFANDDYNTWGPLAVVSFIALMLVGGCTGSTAGSIKVFRYQVLRVLIGAYMKRLASPNRVVGLTYHGTRLSEDVPTSVLAFFAVFLGTIFVSTLALAGMGLDFVTALSSATATITNVGPGLGPIVGPAGNYAPLPDAAKWILSTAMLMGRLELFTVLLLVVPNFWRA